jgi:protease IV
MSYPKTERSPWLIVLAIIVVLAVFSIGVVSCVGVFVMDDGFTTGNVAVIPIKGPIVVDGDSSLFAATKYAVSGDIKNLITKAEEDQFIEAIVFDINSPGGSPVASAEIARAISETEKPTVAVIREVGASGSYWAAVSADHVIAHEVSIVGSIGVIASYLQYGDLLDEFNVSYERFVAGDHKDMGSPFREMDSVEKDKYQSILDQMHTIFIREVATARGLDKAYVRDLATGEIFLGATALNYGLIDQLGGKQEALDHLEAVLGTEVEPVPFESDPGFFELLAGVFDDTGFNVGTGIGSALAADEGKVRV